MMQLPPEAAGPRAGTGSAGSRPRGAYGIGKGLVLAVALAVAGCGGGDPVPGGEPVTVIVPPGASFANVTDSLVSRGLVTQPRLFTLLARVRGLDRGIRAGSYSFEPGASWSSLLEDLVTGRVLTVAVTVPEGFTLTQMAGRFTGVTGLPEDSILTILRDESMADDRGLPGPGLEGYLFPDTYRFAEGTRLEQVVDAMVRRYRDMWTPRRQSRREELGLTEAEVVTLASIVQAEARVVDEMPTIAAVYHNRLRLGWPLQADPTVLYALGGHRPRLLYAAMDSVANHPYNTYTHAGLPPGAIGAPGEAALEATLFPLDVDFLFFVARADGSHVFTRTLAEHNRAVRESRRERDANRNSGSAATPPPGGP
jgi:UPF0755 protein